ncbi:MAG: MASE3 domain-containing protein [Methanospirillum sp.]
MLKELRAAVAGTSAASAAARLAVAGAVLGGLVLLGTRDYLLFHSVVEVAGIAVAFAVFLLVWNTRRVLPDSFFLLVGIAFAFIGGLDLIHTLAYRGMGIFGNSSDLATQLWLAARYFQSIVFLIAALLIGRSVTTGRRYDPAIFVAGCAGATALLLASIFVWGIFPAAFIDGSGLTPFKIGSEYVISLIMLATIALLVISRERFDRTVFLSLVAAMAFLIAGELAFSSYANVYDVANMLGHLFRLVSVYFFYQAIVVVGLTRPTDLLFRELTRREEALRRSEQRYRSLVELAPDAIFINRDDRIDYVNPAGLQLFGASVPDDVVGRPVLDRFAPAHRDRVRERIRQLHEGSIVPLAHEQIVRLDGSIRDVEVAAFPFDDEAGPTIEVILRDVTDRKRAERELVARNDELVAFNEELRAIQDALQTNNDDLVAAEQHLRESEARLVLALEVSGLGTCDTDLVRGTVWRSPRFDRIFGNGASEPGWSKEQFLEHVLPPDREAVAAAMSTALANRTQATVECRIRRADGALRWVAVNAQWRYDEAGVPVRTIALVQDITERKEDEETLKEYAAKLAASNEDLQRFAYVASHDLQEPLRSIVSFSQLLERRYTGQLGEDADEFIGYIVEGGLRMQMLIQDLLAFSRVTSSTQTFAPIETEAVLADVEATLEQGIREAGAVVTHDPLPAVRGDRTQLGQVFANLIGNAIKYRRPGVPPHIHVGARRIDGLREFSVADNGIGIDPEYFDRVFVIFQRLHTRDEYEGTGIGLAIVKRIVERHGGTVRIESTPGEGTTFYFTMPAA